LDDFFGRQDFAREFSTDASDDRAAVFEVLMNVKNMSKSAAGTLEKFGRNV
jgi:hypothetical protein